MVFNQSRVGDGRIKQPVVLTQTILPISEMEVEKFIRSVSMPWSITQLGRVSSFNSG